ncbi:NLR family CARD domain-containing protein 3-like, partial [Silurus meridionalis]|uniref:NLR family CARD domain-containing protein 3-like n=1 Tax=Silurus meridionalis TaxID=175797 RepID=UPI001EEA0A38
AAVYSGVCTQIFREEFGLHQSKVYCFVHLSIQEHLAALYVHLTFMKEQRSVLKQNQDDDDHSDYDDDGDDKSDYDGDYGDNIIECRTLSDVHMRAVDQALYSPTGHLDLFLRFLLGLSLESNQKLLHSLVTQTGSSSQNKEKTVQYIKKMISEDLTAEKSINLFHCLNELGDDSLVEEIQQYLKSGAQSELSPSQWSAEGDQVVSEGAEGSQACEMEEVTEQLSDLSQRSLKSIRDEEQWSRLKRIFTLSNKLTDFYD